MHVGMSQRCGDEERLLGEVVQTFKMGRAASDTKRALTSHAPYSVAEHDRARVHHAFYAAAAALARYHRHTQAVGAVAADRLLDSGGGSPRRARVVLRERHLIVVVQPYGKQLRHAFVCARRLGDVHNGRDAHFQPGHRARALAMHLAQRVATRGQRVNQPAASAAGREMAHDASGHDPEQQVLAEQWRQQALTIAAAFVSAQCASAAQRLSTR
ncbi:hypothetical protein FGB62_2g56 [Gracilaria domingensis]|nr:hypothetical protein FGB62_2g56 [Gracilaria domingensis]